MSEEPGRPSPDAERRLSEHLESLRRSDDGPGTRLVARVVRTARWQRLVRAPLRTVGALAGAVYDGVVKLLFPTQRKGR